MYVESLPTYLFFGALIGGLYILWPNHRLSELKRSTRGIADIDAYKRDTEHELAAKRLLLDRDLKSLDASKKSVQAQWDKLNLILKTTERIYPWAAAIHADLVDAEAGHTAWRLESRRRPAKSAAQEIRSTRKLWRERVTAAKFGQYKALVYESAFPFLIDLIEGAPNQTFAAVDQSPEEEREPERFFLSEAEYARLDTNEKAQIALDRYLGRKKTNWEIGRDYERLIGCEYECNGWSVIFHGAVHGIEDLGRDLIAMKDGETHIIQCKYWSQWKTVHENAIFQLFGSIIDFMFEKQLMVSAGQLFDALDFHKIKGVLVTSTMISDRAMSACRALRIDARQGMPMRNFPMVKCNVAKDGTKIFHLPFDQQYDRIKIEAGRGEFYCQSVSEAVAQGFRRAHRWMAVASA